MPNTAWLLSRVGGRFAALNAALGTRFRATSCDRRSLGLRRQRRARRKSGRPGNRRDGAAFSTAKAPLNDQRRLLHATRNNTYELRSGVVSGRVILVLISSFVGAVIALGLAWALFIRPH